jgi:hypothetical protein
MQPRAVKAALLTAITPPAALLHFACSNIGAGTSLDLFTGSSLTLRRRDGARVFASTTPQPAMLHDLVRQGKWDKALRLAR